MGSSRLSNPSVLHSLPPHSLRNAQKYALALLGHVRLVYSPGTKARSQASTRADVVYTHNARMTRRRRLGRSSLPPLRYQRANPFHVCYPTPSFERCSGGAAGGYANMLSRNSAAQ
jgi:hypothetical protein